jgi:hypothetical protein
MIDLRDRNGVVARLRDAARRFERGAPVPVAVREFLPELTDALSDSGPLELGVTSGEWLDAVGAAERVVASAGVKPSSKTTRTAKRSLLELERFFSDTSTWHSKIVGVFGLAVLIAVPIGIVAGSHDKFATAIWVAAAIAALALVVVMTERYEPNVKQPGTWLDLSDIQLFAHCVKLPASEVKSFVRGKLGMYVRPVLIATDRRLLLARPANEAPGGPESSQFELAWEIAYRDITTFSSRCTGGDSPATIVSVESPGRTMSYKFPGSDGDALLAILKRRAPEAFVPSVSRSRGRKAAPAP